MEAYSVKMKNRHDSDAWMMWHGAALARGTEKMPPLRRFMTEQKKPMKHIDEDAIIARLKAYQKRFEDGRSN